MGDRIIDDNGAISFVDDNGVQCFVDDLGNFTCEELVSTKHIRKPRMISHFQSTDWKFVR